MRFGDVRKLAIDLDPVVPSWDRRTPSDRGPWARLVFWIHQENLCQNWVSSTHEVLEGVYVPLAPIADWLVRNAKSIAYQESSPDFPTDIDLPRAVEEWKAAAPGRGFDEDSWDDRRFDWSGRHFLLAGADGAWLPNLAFVKADETLWISAGRVTFATPGAPSFLYEPGFHTVAWTDARAVFSEFVDYVGGFLRDAGLTDIYPWSAQPEAFARALEIEVFEYLCLSLGLTRQRIVEHFGVESSVELRRLLDIPADAPPTSSVTLQALRDLEWEKDVVDIALRCDIDTRNRRGGAFLKTRLRALDAASADSPEEQGYAAARLLRQDLGLNGQPLPNLEDLFRAHFDIEVDDRRDVETRHDHSISGGHVDGFAKVILLHSPQTQKPWSRRMELVRGVGHLLLDAGPEQHAIGAGSSIRSVGPRRRRSGTFAAEMLLPQDAIRRRSGGILDEAARPEIFESLMEDYGVGAHTAAWQCYNAGFLSSREVVQELIASYGSAR